jgi:hypothetical protein
MVTKQNKTAAGWKSCVRVSATRGLFTRHVVALFRLCVHESLLLFMCGHLSAQNNNDHHHSSGKHHKYAKRRRSVEMDGAELDWEGR